MTIKEAFALLANKVGSGMKNPFFIARNLHDAFVEIEEKISDSGVGCAAEDVTYDSEYSHLSADNVQDAIDEVLDSIPKLISYSTSEQNTGIKWIDNKVIYQKTWVFDSSIELGSNSWTNTPIVVATEGIGHIVNVSAGRLNTMAVCLYANCDQTNVQVLQTRSNTIRIDYITLQYTKAS